MRKQWRCFHCDEVFTSYKLAREHFGADEGKDAACQLKSHEGHILTALRKVEDQLDRYRDEDSDLMRAMYALEADHQDALRRAEEQGYEKGLRDAKTAP